MKKHDSRKDRLRYIRIAEALYEFAEMTGYLPKVATEALIRLRREGKTDCLYPATVRRFRELLDAITHERERGRIED